MDRRLNLEENRPSHGYFVAWVVLVLERAWSASAPVFWAVGLFIAVTFLGLWEWLPPYLHLAGLVTFTGALLLAIRYFTQSFSWPSGDEVAAALERHNHLPHRPLRSLGSALALGAEDETSQLLWNLHRQQQFRNLSKIRLFWPDLSLGNGDFLSLRAAVLLLVISSFMIGGPKASARIETAFLPQLRGSAPVIGMDIWAVPPDYTGVAPQLIAQKPDGREFSAVPAVIKIPEGSRLVGRLSGGDEGVPKLVSDNAEYVFSKIDQNNFQIDIEATRNGRWRLEKDGDELAFWDLQIIPDAPPAVRLLTPPTLTRRGALQLMAEASDDYGVLELAAHLTRSDMPVNLQGRIKPEEIRIKLPFTSGAKQISSKSYNDLTSHPWAGLAVTLVVTAQDAVGQMGASKPVDFVLPERKFTHPIARALVAQRKKLMSDPANNRIDVLGALDALTALPEALTSDISALLLISVARGTLLFDYESEATYEVAEYMWQAALKYENGNFTLAEAALRAAQNALMAALSGNADDAEIKRLVDDVKQAMQNFLAEFSKNQQTESTGQQLQSKDLNAFLDKIDQLSAVGARDAARQLLSRLQDILENLQAVGGAPSQSQNTGQKILNDLGEMMSAQQNILDKTLRSNQQQGQKTGETETFETLAKQQEALRQMLGDLMGDMGLNADIPVPLGQAERAMNRARGALENGDASGAQNAQKQVLEQLQRTAQGLVQQMRQGRGGQGAGGRFGKNGPRGDPLGRAAPSQPLLGEGGTDIQLFKPGYLSNSRQILDELRRRLSDPNRSDLEKKYLQRLLERFR